jgi:glycerol-3-phosphate dehydrogenase
VSWSVRHEYARTVEDVLARRTRALFLDAAAGMEIAPRVARLMAVELGCDADWQQRQVSAFLSLARGYLPDGCRTT